MMIGVLVSLTTSFRRSCPPAPLPGRNDIGWIRTGGVASLRSAPPPATVRHASGVQNGEYDTAPYDCASFFGRNDEIHGAGSLCSPHPIVSRRRRDGE